MHDEIKIPLVQEIDDSKLMGELLERKKMDLVGVIAQK